MIALLLLILLVPILLAPLETAGWWSRRRVATPARQRRKSLGRKPEMQMVYFTGVAGYSGDFLARREEALLDLIQERFPEMKIHHDVFPYSVSNLPLDGERAFRALWIWLHSWRLKVPNNVFDALIVIRNVGQLLVSSDPRYGPVFNRGLAEQMESRLYTDVPTVFLAYSGGAQMAVGAADEMKRILDFKAPLHLITLGGVFTDDPGISSFDSVTQLLGTRDRWVVHLGRLIFPGLWRWQFWSTWNRYRRSGRFQTVVPGDHCHVGKSDYFGFAEAGDGRTYQQISADVVCSTILACQT
jgi:hypothetical protein